MSYNLKFSIKSKGEDKNNDKYCCATIKDFEISVPQSISRTNSNTNTNNMPKQKLIMILLE